MSSEDVTFKEYMEELWKHVELYRGLGFNIIPLRFKEKTPIFEWKEYQERKTTEEEVERWFKDKVVNIGIVCGKISDNLFVIDFDNEEVLSKAFQDKEKLLESTLVVKTGKGYHVYFKAKKLVPTTPIIKEVTVKGEGSYVVAPPSIHPSGKQYKIISKTTKPKTIDNPDLLIYNLKKLFSPEEEKGKEEFEEKQPVKLGKKVPYCIKLILEEGVEEGERNERAFDLARYFYNRGRTPREILRELQKWNRKNRPPLPEKELEYVVKSVVRHKYAFGCGRLKDTKYCHEVCPYYSEEEEEEDLDKLIEEQLNNNVTILDGPIHFHPDVGMFYIIPINTCKSLKQIPVLNNFTLSKIPVLSEHNQNDISHSTLHDSCISHFVFRYKNEKLIHDENFKKKLLLLYVTCQRNPEEMRNFDTSIFENMVAWYRYYVYFDDDILYYVVVCWIVGTYLHPMFSYFPFLIFRGEKGSAKGTNLMILMKVCWNATKKFVSPSEATIFRIIEQTKPTMIIDEAHRILRHKIFGPIISAILEAGVEQGAVVPRCEEGNPNKVLEFKVYCPKVLASREELEHEDKAITIIMTKREDPQYAKRRNEIEKDTRWEEARTEIVKFALTRWKDVYEEYVKLQPTNKLTGRYFNLWAPILAICKIIFPDKFDEMLSFAEQQIEGKLLGSWEKENIVLQALAAHLEELKETEEAYKVKLKDLVEWSEFDHWRPVRDAIVNLKLLKKDQQTREGKIYYLYKDRLEKLLKERKIIEEEESEKGEIIKEEEKKEEKTVFDDLISKCVNRVEKGLSQVKCEICKENVAEFLLPEDVVEKTSYTNVCRKCIPRVKQLLESPLSDTRKEEPQREKEEEGESSTPQPHDKELDVTRVLYALQEMGGEAGISALAMKLRMQEGELRLFLQDHPKYFVVKGPFVYTKTRWDSLKTNGDGEDVLGERSL
ncbi:MAG: bifunctional DNA primase/polymerase [Candidatus Odinarchaeota archaeon]|nr:bifunctional DNA primase/polymerase [Candidatus Odinarchaeota archaeon]